MDLNKIIGELLEERKRLDRIVSSLEQLESGGKLTDGPPVANRRGRKSMDQNAREEVSKRMKSYWANRKNNST